jgi:glutamyl-tRNA reductase
MLDIVLIGLNHKTAPVEVRECLAFSDADAEKALTELPDHPEIAELVLWSTCNRIEILMATRNRDPAIAAAKSYLAKRNAEAIGSLENVLYVHSGEAAVRHVFRVAASLDSMMVGEPQILGQIKEAYLLATQKKTSGVLLNRLMHRTFFVAKRIRTETGIGDHAVSISFAAVELGRKIFGSLEGKKVLLVGAGEMAELAVEHLMRQRVGQISVANRTLERAMTLAGRFKGKAIGMEEIPLLLQEVDIIISSTGSREFVITRDQVKGVIRSRRNRPIFFIDIAVPRDIDPDINRLTNAYVYDIDDLKGIIDQNIADRQAEAVKAERLIDEAVIRFRQWYDSLDVIPTIKALRQRIETIAEMEIEKTLQSIPYLKTEDALAFDRMKHALINKILHHPTLFLKENGCHGDRSLYLDATRKLFNLDEESL